MEGPPGAAPAPTALAAIRRGLLGAPPRAGSARVVAIDGPSGAGKTTLADRLAVALAAGGWNVPVVRMDDLYPGWDGLEDAVPRLLEWVLAPLAGGRAARYRRYDWAAGRYGEWCEVVPGGEAPPLLVVEGVGSGARACAPYLSLLVWVDAPPEVRFARAIGRDGDAYLPHWDRWARQEDAHFARERTAERADLLVDERGNVGRDDRLPAGDR
jgi:hypothetical protein